MIMMLHPGNAGRDTLYGSVCGAFLVVYTIIFSQEVRLSMALKWGGGACGTP